MSDKYRTHGWFRQWADSEARAAEICQDEHDRSLEFRLNPRAVVLLFEAEIKKSPYDRGFLRAMRVSL